MLITSPGSIRQDRERPAPAGQRPRDSDVGFHGALLPLGVADSTDVQPLFAGAPLSPGAAGLARHIPAPAQLRGGTVDGTPCGGATAFRPTADGLAIASLGDPALGAGRTEESQAGPAT